MTQHFPAGFQDLERFADWALERRDARYKKRLASSMETIRAFYDAMASRIDAILEYLNPKPLETIGGEDRRLLLLSLAWMDAARAVEVLGTPDVKYGFEAHRFNIRDVASL